MGQTRDMPAIRVLGKGLKQGHQKACSNYCHPLGRSN